MITLFTSPKPFHEVNGWNQLNALRSWKAICPENEIIIFGASTGAQAAAAEVNAVLVNDIECSSTGAPSFNKMVEYTRQYGRYDLQVYVNADILLNRSILDSIISASRRFDRFLMIGERMDLASDVELDVRQSDWVMQAIDLIKSSQLTTHGSTGIDYFGFVRGMWEELPPVFMGRAGCDQSLLHFILKSHIPIIDATLSVIAVHQFHDYQHLVGGVQEVFNGNDRRLMNNAHKLHHSTPSIADANYRFMENGEIAENKSRTSKLRQFELTLRYHYNLHYGSFAIRLLQYLKGRKNVSAKKLPVDSILNGWKRCIDAFSK